MPIKKIELDNLHPANPLNELVTEINNNFDAVIDAVKNINNSVPVVGATGAKGDTGPQGPAGIQGPQGEVGPQGLPGLAGRDGVDGKDGTNGKDGEPGIQGPTGSQGPAGRDGKDGLQGPMGPKGDTGPVGPQGPAGAIGLQGPQGPAGATGPQGLQGLKGDTGPQGPVGSPGAMNQKQYIPSSLVNITGIGQTILSTTFTSNGYPVLLTANGDANPINGGSWCKLQWFRNGVAVGKPVHLESAQSNVNVTYAVIATDTPPAGTNTYTLQTVGVFGPNSWNFGESDPPVTNFVELSGATGAQGPAGVGIKGFASGYVNAGTYVTLDNIKATVTTAWPRGLSVATVSGTMTLSISANYALAGGASGNATTYPGATYTTTPSGSWFGWGFGNAGDASTYLVNDYTNKKFYRITLMIGASYIDNFISIEKLGEGVVAAPRVVGVASPTV